MRYSCRWRESKIMSSASSMCQAYPNYTSDAPEDVSTALHGSGDGSLCTQVHAACGSPLYRVGTSAVKAIFKERATLADGLSADAEPSERVAPATARAVTCSDFADSVGFALSDSESGDPKPTPSQTDGRRCRDALGDNQQPRGRHVRRIGMVQA